MFQSAITCREYEHFIEVARESEEEALKLLCRYTNTDQQLLHDALDAIRHGAKLPKSPFSHQECELQDAIARGDFKKTFDDAHRKQF